MQVDFNQPLRDLEGNPVEETEEVQVIVQNNGKPEAVSQIKKVYNQDGTVRLVTFKTLCARALIAMFRDEQNLPAEKKVSRFTLAQKIVAATGPVELSLEEAVMAKEVVGKMFSPLIVGQVFGALKIVT